MKTMGEILLQHESYVMRLDGEGRVVLVGGLYTCVISIERYWL